MSMTPSNFLYFPLKNGKWLRDSQGKPRVYKSVKSAIKNLKKEEYDHIQVYAIDDVISREEIEKAVRNESMQKMQTTKRNKRHFGVLR